MTYMPTPWHKNLCNGVMKFAIFYQTIPWSSLLYTQYGRREDDFLKKQCLFSVTFMPTPQHKKPCTWGHEIYNFCRPLFGFHNYALLLCTSLLSEPYPVQRRRDYRKYINFTLFTPKLPILGGGGSCNLQFYVSLPYICYIPIQFRLAK